MLVLLDDDPALGAGARDNGEADQARRLPRADRLHHPQGHGAGAGAVQVVVCQRWRLLQPPARRVAAQLQAARGRLVQGDGGARAVHVPAAHALHLLRDEALRPMKHAAAPHTPGARAPSAYSLPMPPARSAERAHWSARREHGCPRTRLGRCLSPRVCPAARGDGPDAEPAERQQAGASTQIFAGPVGVALHWSHSTGSGRSSRCAGDGLSMSCSGCQITHADQC
mmetsp:Transcript_20353/g.52557  ORF Transcript_20353/g.52557 Transcript_20353/m.52557 type:complete len:226 (+) Transcript_20353:2466-3143(+)